MEARDSDPAIIPADKGYDSDPIRQDPVDRGAVPEIPTQRNRHIHCSIRRLASFRLWVRLFHAAQAFTQALTVAPQACDVANLPARRIEVGQPQLAFACLVL
jgi:transposase